MPKLATLEDVLKSLQDIREKIESINLSRIAPRQISVNTLAQISNNLGVVTAGEFRTGNGADPGKGFSGVRIAYPAMSYGGGLYNIVGVSNDTLQIGVSASDGKLYAGGGYVILDAGGIMMNYRTGSTAWLKFGYNGSSSYAGIALDSNNTLVFSQLNTGNNGYRFGVKTTSGDTPSLYYRESAVNNLTELIVSGGQEGSKIAISDNYYNGIYLYGTSNAFSGGNCYISIGSAKSTPPSPSIYGDVVMYITGNKFVIMSNDGGTIRYKYLDLSGTGVTWVHSTTAP